MCVHEHTATQSHTHPPPLLPSSCASLRDKVSLPLQVANLHTSHQSLWTKRYLHSHPTLAFGGIFTECSKLQLWTSFIPISQVRIVSYFIRCSKVLDERHTGTHFSVFLSYRWNAVTSFIIILFRATGDPIYLPVLQQIARHCPKRHVLSRLNRRLWKPAPLQNLGAEMKLVWHWQLLEVIWKSPVFVSCLCLSIWGSIYY